MQGPYLRTKDHLKEKGINNIVGFILTIIKTVSFCFVSVYVQTLYIKKIKYTYIHVSNGFMECNI